MTPNLFVATQTLFSPHKWFKHQKSERSLRRTEHWETPVPGIYEYIPGRGWYLVATDKDASTSDADSTALPTPDSDATPTPKNLFPASIKRETVPMTTPVQAIYSKVLKRYLLAPDYTIRKKTGRIRDPATNKFQSASFFRLDDGIAWVQCWDAHGEFIPGPYKLWCLDRETGHFRHMLKGDDPNYTPSRQNSVNSVDSSVDSLTLKRHPSQESRTTQYRPGPGTPSKDGASVPSTRANSIFRQQIATPTGTGPGSLSSSRAGSRRNSPKRSPGIPLEEAKVRLREMARAQEEESRLQNEKDGDAISRTSSSGDEDAVRGRPRAE